MKPIVSPNINYAWSEIMVRELSRLGIDTFYIAPGSRSSPLALSAFDLAENVYTHFDERGLGFAALGHARATGKPTVIITTSGSAVANLWPAVCEASADAVPLLIISADRPPELRDTGANQTMDQVKLFGSYVRWQVDLPCPDLSIDPAFLLSTIDYAVAKSTGPNPGPVHLNQMFREPLAPTRINDGSRSWLKKLGAWWSATTPWTSYPPCPAVLTSATRSAINSKIKHAHCGIIVAGGMSRYTDAKAVLALAEKLNWPIIPDIRSGLRIKHDHPNIIHMADQLLLSERFANASRPDVILHFGGRIISKRIQRYCADSGADLIMIDKTPVRIDPDNRVTMRVTVSPEHAAVQFKTSSSTPDSWLKKWKRFDRKITKSWIQISGQSLSITEPRVAFCISRQLPAKHELILASSMPIRDVEMYGSSDHDHVNVVSNRGVSGIDGNLASAIGYSNGSGRRVTLLIGDLALLHDLNSLAMIKHSRQPITIVAVNNDGGGIFSFLPIAAAPRHYEACFGLPHGLSFKSASAMFGLSYVKPTNMDELSHAYTAACQSKSSTLIEVVTDRKSNVREHREIQAQLKKIAES